MIWLFCLVATYWWKELLALSISIGSFSHNSPVSIRLELGVALGYYPTSCVLTGLILPCDMNRPIQSKLLQEK